MKNPRDTPEIQGVPENVCRPLWSVMIPAYNCAATLHETLQSVLGQDPGPDKMQIEVVDDGSTSDEVRAVVDRLGKGRVSYFRQSATVGPVQNFNTCIRRSRGYLIHILHGDDFVHDGFYEKMHRLSISVSQASFFCARAWIFRNSKKMAMKSLPLRWMKQCTRNAAPLFYVNRVRAPSVVMRRSFYERCGGFDPALRHVADWEMWIRAVSEGGGVFFDEPLAWYRSVHTNDTSQLQLSAENLRDWLRLLNILREKYRHFHPRRFMRNLLLFGLCQTLFLLLSGKFRASLTTLSFLCKDAVPVLLKEFLRGASR